MTPDVQLAALALIECTARQIVFPEQTELHRNELAVIMRDVDPTMVALEIATVLAGVVSGFRVPIHQLIEVQRARIVGKLDAEGS
jgi:hypothetical protein